MSSEVTADTITDEQILRIGRLFRDGTAHDAICRHTATVALGLTLDSPALVSEARARMAGMWNGISRPARR